MGIIFSGTTILRLIYVGKRSDCNNSLVYSSFGGYIIEPISYHRMDGYTCSNLPMLNSIEVYRSMVDQNRRSQHDQKHIYCLFQTVGDTDDNRTDVLLGVFTSVILAKQHCLTLPHTLLDINSYDSDNDDQAVHQSMNVSNGYTYVGKRSDCIGGLACGCFGGYIIERILVDPDPPISVQTDATNVNRFGGNPVRISDALATFLGKNKETILQRDLVNKLLHAYIKDNRIQLDTNKVMWRYDAALFGLFGKTEADTLGYMNMQTVLKPHLTNVNINQLTPEQLDGIIALNHQAIKTEGDEYSAKIHDICGPLITKLNELNLEYEYINYKYDEEVNRIGDDGGDNSDLPVDQIVAKQRIHDIKAKYAPRLDRMRYDINQVDSKIARYHARIKEHYRCKGVTFIPTNQCRYCITALV